MRRTRSPCCARAVNGHGTAAPPSSVMNARRFTSNFSRASKRKISTAGDLLHCGISKEPLSAVGRTWSFWDFGSMSALAYFAASTRTSPEVREVPIGDIDTLFDHLDRKPTFAPGSSPRLTCSHSVPVRKAQPHAR